ncbi:MAG: PKD domain-containing protein [Cryomorphaceae bacterium]
MCYALKKNLLTILLLAVSLLHASAVFAQCGDSIDLATWVLEGDTNNGNWVVTSGGNTVNQTINGDPTFYVSPDSFINVIVTGNIQVATTADDDWIGFVFGYVDPDTNNPTNYDFYLFDWKQNNQNFGGWLGQEGFSLSHIQGNVTNFPQAFSSKAGPFVDLIATNYGNTLGWNDLQTYAFALTYTNTRTVVAIDGDTIFDVFGCFPPGRFGFYNYSQSDVNYSDFSYRVAAAFEVLTPNVCIGDTARFIALSDSCENAAGIPVNNTITGWYWDFGDGNTSNDTNANHYYQNPGTYQVQLVVTDYLGCTDTAISSVEIYDVQTDLGNDTSICVNDVIVLDAGTSATAYVWSTGAASQTINASLPGSYWVAVSGAGGCTDTDTVVITNIALPIVNLGNDTSICNNDTIVLHAGNAGASFLWNDGSTLDSLVLSDSGTYHVAVTYPSGCSNTDSIVISNYAQPVVTPPNPELCYGDTINISAAGANTYSWFPAAGLSATTGAVVQTFTLVDTFYNVIGIDTNGCTDTSVFFVDVHDLPTLTIVGSDSVCTGDSVSLNFLLTGEGPWDISYSVQGNTFFINGIASDTHSIVVADSGTFTPLTVTDVNCSNTGFGSAYVHHYPLPSLTLNTLDTAICIQDTLPLVISGAQSYNWAPIYNATSLIGDSISVYPTVDTSYSVIAIDSNGCVNYDTVNVFIDTLPTITLAMTGDSVCKLDTTTITAGGAVSYSWSSAPGLSNYNQAMVNAFPTATTIYVVTGTDANGCESSNDTTVTVLVLPDIDVQPGFGEICVGETETITAQTYYSYTWSPLATLTLDGNNNDSVIASPVDTTVYTVTATDSLGCTSDTTYQLAVTPLPVLTLSQDDSVICPNINTQLHVSGGLSYVWGPNSAISGIFSDSPTVNPGTTREYFVTATGPGGCQSVASVTVAVWVIDTFSAGNDTAICKGDTIQLNGFGGVSYQWYPNLFISDATVPTPMCFTSGTRLYSLEITDINGCVSWDNVRIYVNPLPFARAGADDTLCVGDLIQLGGSPTGPPGSSYQWTPATGLNNAFLPNPNANPSTTTTYTVLVTDTNGCQKQNSTDIRVNDLPELELLSIPDYLCQGDSASIEVTPDLETYAWLPSDRIVDPSKSNVIAFPKDTLTYSVSGTDTNGCTRTIDVYLPVKRAPFVNIRGNYDMCFGDTIQFDANASAGELKWSPSEYVSQSDTLLPLAFPTEPVYFTLKLTDAYGCSNVDSSLVFVHPLPRADAGEDVRNCYMQVVYLGGASVTGPENEILWTPGEKLNKTNIEHPRVLSTEIDTFVLRVESPEGCVNYDSVIINSECYVSLYAPNSFTPDADQINDEFRVYGRNVYNPHLIIYDRWGKVLFESHDLEKGWNGNFVSSNLPAPIGSYFWQVTYESETGRELSHQGLFNLIR